MDVTSPAPVPGVQGSTNKPTTLAEHGENQPQDPKSAFTLKCVATCKSLRGLAGVRVSTVLPSR